MLVSSFVAGLVLPLAVVQCQGDDPVRPYPLPDADLSTTTILNHSKYISSFAEQQWYLDNVPFLDVPDKSLQDVYYYRTSVVKRHLKYYHSGHGKLSQMDEGCLNGS